VTTNFRTHKTSFFLQNNIFAKSRREHERIPFSKQLAGNEYRQGRPPLCGEKNIE
jgi:hypothetical protein